MTAIPSRISEASPIAKSRGALEINTILNPPPPSPPIKVATKPDTLNPPPPSPPIKVATKPDTLNSPPPSNALSRRSAPAAQQQQQQQAATARSPPFSGGEYTHASGYEAGTPHSSPDASRWSYLAYGTASSPYAFFGGYQPTIQDQHGSLYAMPLGSHYGSGQVTLNTPDGPIIAPYDTTTGSRAQHEKRRKNANSSSRFRKRKKEKEIKNTRRMEELEHNLKTTKEERDYLRSIIESALGNRGQLPPLLKGLFDPRATEGQEYGDGAGGTTGSGGGSGGGGGGRRED